MKNYLLGIALVVFSSASTKAQNQLITNGDFSSGTANWTTSGNWNISSLYSCYNSPTAYAYTGTSGSPVNNMYGNLKQTVTIPSTATSATLSFYSSQNTQETSCSTCDYIEADFFNAAGTSILHTFADIYNSSAAAYPGCQSYGYHSYTVPSSYFGQTVQLAFNVHTDGASLTVFRIDDVSLTYVAGTTCITPGTPASASGSATGQTTASLSWTGGNPTGSPTVTYYWVVGTSPSVTYGNGVAQGTTTGTSATATGLSCNTTYYLRVYAQTSCDNTYSGYRTSSSFTTSACNPTCTTPGTPATASGTATGQTTASLSWTGGNPTGSPTVTYYWVVGTSSSVTYGNGVAQGTTTGTSATATGLSCNTTYYLRVYALTSCDNTYSGYRTSSSFTTDVCSSGSIYGVDISHYNGSVSWATVYAAGKSFSFVKATEGVNTDDSYFTTNMTSSNPNGVVLGPYHLARPDYSSNNTPANESSHFLNIAGNYIGNGFLPPALDLEPAAADAYIANGYSHAQLAQWVEDWCYQIYLSTGIWPVLYTSRCVANYLVSYYGNTINANVKLWIADYPETPGTPVGYSGCGPNWNTWPWIFHQYFAPATAGNNPTTYANPGMDQDFFNGTNNDFNNLINTSSPCTPPTASVNSPTGSSPLTMTCTASGGTIAYKWYSGSSCSGTVLSTNATLTNITASGTYSCKAYITGYEGTCNTCATGTATINSSAPANDLCSGAIQISCGQTVNGSTVTATATDNPTTCVTVLNTAPGVWYKFTGNGNNVSITTCSSNTDYDTKIGLFSGSCGSLTCISGDDDDSNCGSSGLQSTLSSIPTINGTTYYIFVTGFSADTGIFELNLSCQACTPPSVTATSTSATCGLCNGSVTATGGTNYSWSGGLGSGASHSNVCAGSYTVTVTDANSCSATASTTVGNTGGPSVTITTTNANCGSANGTATAIATGGATPYSYSWSNGQTTAAATNLSANTYQVTVSDGNGCSATASVTVGNTGGPSVTTTTTNANCGSANGTATAIATGGATPYSYSWSSGSTTATATNLSANTYQVTVTDANNCSAFALATVGNTGGPSVTTTTINANCGSANGSATAIATGGATPYSYSWSNGQTTATATNLSANTYQVTVSDGNGCSATAFATVANSGSSLVADAGPDQTTSGSTVTIGGNLTASGGVSPYTYQWSPNSNLSSGTVSNPTVSGLTVTTTYNLTVTDANGCSAFDQVTVNFTGGGLAPVANIIVDQSNSPCPFSAGFHDGSSNSPTSWFWEFLGNCISPDTSTQKDPSNILYNQQGSYTVRLTVANSYGSDNTTSNITITGNCDCNGIPIGVDDLSKIRSFSITPNPSSGIFTLSLETTKPEQIQLKVFDLVGQLIKQESTVALSGVFTKQIDLGRVAKGIYQVQIKVGGQILNKRLEIQ